VLEEEEMVEYSFVGTLYNNVNRLKVCLDSVVRASAGLDCEIVIVDNYSTDGSFEMLRDYARKQNNIRVIRMMCSRGLGRQVAYKNSQGKYLITIDMDTEYLSEKLQRFLLAFEHSRLRDHYALKTWGSLCMFPRHIVEKVEGWRDYNMGEDMDILTRLFSASLAVFVPIDLEINEPYEDEEVKKTSIGVLEDRRREQRYAKGSRGLSRTWRILKNKIDYYCALDYTLRKAITRNRQLRTKIRNAFYVGTFLVISKILNILYKRPTVHVDSDLNNAEYVFYKSIVNMVDPSEFGLEAEQDPDLARTQFAVIACVRARGTYGSLLIPYFVTRNDQGIINCKNRDQLDIYIGYLCQKLQVPVKTIAEIEEDFFKNHMRVH
jgi:glycosyltransferase involved in cell wall biosynthesis